MRDVVTLVQLLLADDLAGRNILFAKQIRKLKARLVKENMWSSTVAVTQMQNIAVNEFKARQNLILQTWQRVLPIYDSMERTLLLPQAAQSVAHTLATERDYLEDVVTSQPVGGLPNPAGFLDELCDIATSRLQAELGLPEVTPAQARSIFLSLNKSTAIRKRVFISYAREDVDYAKRMFRELINAAYDPWLDCESLLPGQRWESRIEQAIRESHYFLALISTRSTIKRGYVQKEIRDALDILRQIPENEVFLIPARLDDCELTHSALRGVQWVDLFPKWETGVEKIIRALKSGEGAA